MHQVMLVKHTHRSNAIEAAEKVEQELVRQGIRIINEGEDEAVDLVLAMGGDGTILSAATHAREHDVPLLGVNMGHMGFLAELSEQGVDELAKRIADGDFIVEERLTLDITVKLPAGKELHDWALNEAVVIHTDAAHPVHVALVVDGQDVSTYGADGIVIATPTGSTAYSFSAGGPVVWPDTQAMVIAPLAAHGLFARPLVVSPQSNIEIVILENIWSAPEMWCDGLRQATLPAATSVIARAGEKPIRLARLDSTPFSTRLVEKFHLPIRGWKSPRSGLA
ncbi:NAD kinase [Schaalia sp. ZJ405]|nr:NAD kinase [Schaalia sp. ZJ405]